MPFNHTVTEGKWSVDIDTTQPLVAAAMAKGYNDWVADGLEFLETALGDHPELSVDEALDLINKGATWVRFRRATPEEMGASWTG